jgi:hypothetical protein
MDAAPRSFAELLRDDELGIPVPFACGVPDPYADPAGPAPSARELDRRRVTQCALSRVCGVCGAGLGRPIAFLGSADEVGRNAFHFPPSHVSCAEALAAAYAGLAVPVLGQHEAVGAWRLVTTGGFEFVRPTREDVDRRPTFQPNSLLDSPIGGTIDRPNADAIDGVPHLSVR